MSLFEEAVLRVVKRYLDGEITPEEAMNEIVMQYARRQERDEARDAAWRSE